MCLELVEIRTPVLDSASSLESAARKNSLDCLMQANTGFSLRCKGGSNFAGHCRAPCFVRITTNRSWKVEGLRFGQPDCRVTSYENILLFRGRYSCRTLQALLVGSRRPMFKAIGMSNRTYWLTALKAGNLQNMNSVQLKRNVVFDSFE